MKLIISAALICVIGISCNSNEPKKEETTVSSTDSVTTTTKVEEAPATPTPPMDSATMMKNFEAYATPGDAHKLMASWSGKWNGEVTMWMAPGAPPQTSRATAVNKMVLGGRYQVSNHSGNMMGMPFEGMGTLAYDNNKKVFISTWIDNMGTGIMKIEGPWDEASKTMSLKGKCIDPGAGPNGKEMDIRESFKIIDDKTQLMEMYGPGPDGKEFKMMEIKLTRS